MGCSFPPYKSTTKAGLSLTLSHNILKTAVKKTSDFLTMPMVPLYVGNRKVSHLTPS